MLLNFFSKIFAVSTVDQGLIQKRSPWNGTSFVNEGANERSFRFAAVKNIFNRKTYSDPEVRHNNGWVDEKNSDISTETSTRSSGSLKTVHLSFHMDSASTVPRPAKNKVLLLSDSSLARMKKASSVYIDKNTAFHKQRKKHIEKTIEDKHRSQVKRQMCDSEQQSKERYDRNISNMNELKNVRKKFWSEKKKRVSSTYVSVAALDTPEVDRYAYGLPEEGKEYTFVKKSFVKSKTDYKDKWDKSVQKAKSIVKLLDLKEKVKQTRALPILKPLTSQSKRTKLFEYEANNCEPMKEEDEVAETIDENRNNCDTPEKNCDTPDVSNTNKTDSLIHTLLDIGSEGMYILKHIIDSYITRKYNIFSK